MGNPFYPGGNQPPRNQNGFQTIPGLPNLNDAPPEVRGDIGQLFNWFASNLQGNPQQIMQNMFMGGLMDNTKFNQLSQMANFFRGMLGRR